jgi:hypothetical protein
MYSNNPGDKLASQQVKDGPGKQAWWKEEIKFEIERLKALLRDPLVSEEEKAIAQSQVANYREMSATTTTPGMETSSDCERLPWLQQMYLLADLCENAPQLTTKERARRIPVSQGDSPSKIKPFVNNDSRKSREPVHAGTARQSRYSIR